MEDVAAVEPAKVLVENTYILGPEGYGETYVIKQDKVQKAIQDVLDERLAGQSYDPVTGPQKTKLLAEAVKKSVKSLGIPRHKLLVQVTLGQRQGQAMLMSSRCLWDTQTDTAASATFSNDTLYCVCQVYGLYIE